MNKKTVVSQKRTQTIQQQKAPILPEVEWVSDIAKQFHEQIQRRLQIRENLLKNAEPQRCLLHNITYSIYCTICRKALCASCMYNSLQHRKHRVVPIESATQELRQDLKTFQLKITKVGDQAEGLIESNGEILMKIEKQYSPLVAKLKEFYQYLRIFIRKKEKQQLQKIKQIKESAVAQVSHYNRQLSKMNEVILSKMKECIRQNYKYVQPLAPRSILQTLVQASDFFNQTVLDGEKFKFPIDINKITAAQNQIQGRIDSLLSTFETPMRTNRSLSNKSRSAGKRVSFDQIRSKLQQNKKSDQLYKLKNKSMSNIAGRSQLHRL